jgi:hypothetical protein
MNQTCPKLSLSRASTITVVKQLCPSDRKNNIMTHLLLPSIHKKCCGFCANLTKFEQTGMTLIILIMDRTKYEINSNNSFHVGH